MTPDMSESSNTQNNSNNSNSQNQEPPRNPYLFFLPNFMSYTPRRSDPINTREETNSNSINNNETSNSVNSNNSRIASIDVNRPYTVMERLSNEPPSTIIDENVNERSSNNTNETERAVVREPSRSITSIDRNSSYGILTSNDSLLSFEDILDDPIRNDESELSDGSTQNLIEMLDRIHRINLLTRALEEERRRQRELEREAERERQRELLNEQNELNSFVNLLNTMMFLISAERQLRRPLMEPYRRASQHSIGDDEEREHEEGEEGNRDERRTPGIHYVRPNPNPIITTPFMYTRFEPVPATENESEGATGREGTAYTSPGNVMFINLPLSFDLTNLIQMLTVSSSHKHLGASKEAMENSTRILTPEMMKFGTRMQTQPNCIICQEDFIVNVNKRLRAKSQQHASTLLKEVENESEDEEKQNNEVSPDDDNIRLMPCGHIFHESCIFQWLKDNNTCPVCRYELETEDEEYNEGVHKRMAERGIDIPAFNIDFTFFCSLEKCGQCKFISNILKRRIEGSLPKCNSIENLISHSITQSNAINMRYTRLPCCNHEFHWPCLKEALLKAGYHWEDNNDTVPHFLPIEKKPLLPNQKSLYKNAKNGNIF